VAKLFSEGAPYMARQAFPFWADGRGWVQYFWCAEGHAPRSIRSTSRLMVDPDVVNGYLFPRKQCHSGDIVLDRQFVPLPIRRPPNLHLIRLRIGRPIGFCAGKSPISSRNIDDMRAWAVRQATASAG
jgi:hypothetical protein